MPEQTYIDQLAGQLRCNHAAVITNLEDDLAEHRGRIAVVTRFLHNPAIALDIRQGLARDLQLPEPTT
jgi:hypothetical protein